MSNEDVERHPYALISVREMLALPPPIMQVENFLIAGGVTGITAYGGVGKTWLALELMRCVSTAQPFLGNPDYKSRYGGVLYVGKDSSIFDYARQWRRLTREQSGAPFEGVRFLGDEDDFTLDSAGDWQRLLDTHEAFEFGLPEVNEDGEEERDRGFSLVIFDTLSALTRANQNDNTEMAQVFHNVRRFSESTGCTSVILHHNAKRSEYNDGTDWRGATAGFNSLDAHLHLSGGKKDKYVIAAQWKKFRGITPPPFSYRMHVSDPKVARLEYLGTYAEPARAAQGTDPLGAALHALIVAKPGLRQRDYANEMWEQFHVGHEGVQFSDEKKYRTAVANRIAALISGHLIVRDPKSVDARPLYLPVKKEEQE